MCWEKINKSDLGIQLFLGRRSKKVSVASISQKFWPGFLKKKNALGGPSRTVQGSHVFKAWVWNGWNDMSLLLCIYIYHGPPKPTCLEVSMVNNLVFRWPRPVFFTVLGANMVDPPKNIILEPLHLWDVNKPTGWNIRTKDSIFGNTHFQKKTPEKTHEVSPCYIANGDLLYRVYKRPRLFRECAFFWSNHHPFRKKTRSFGYCTPEN